MHCYFYIQLPLVNTPVQPPLSNAGGEAISLLIPFQAVCLSRRARYKMLDIFLSVAKQQKIISFHKHVTRSRFTLIGVKLLDGVGGQVNM